MILTISELRRRPSPPRPSTRTPDRGMSIHVVCLLLSLGLAGLSNQAEEEALYSDNVVIVLDASGSMGDTMNGVEKMAAAKSALKAVLRQVPQSTHIGLLVFSSRNGASGWLYDLGPRQDARLEQAINRPLPGGGTPLADFIKTGADRLLEKRKRQRGYGTFRLLVVTDGHAENPQAVDLYTREVLARGITMDVIGVAMEQSHTLANIVHSYRSADDPGSLKKAVEEVFAELREKGDDGAADREAFELLSGIPVEIAAAMVQGLTAAADHPIGTQPPRLDPGAEDSGPLEPTSPGGQPSPGGQAGSTPPPIPPVSGEKNFIILLFLGIMALWFITRAKRKA